MLRRIALILGPALLSLSLYLGVAAPTTALAVCPTLAQATPVVARVLVPGQEADVFWGAPNNPPPPCSAAFYYVYGYSPGGGSRFFGPVPPAPPGVLDHVIAPVPHPGPWIFIVIGYNDHWGNWSMWSNWVFI